MRRVVIASIGAALVLGSSAAGAPTWNEPVQLSQGERALGPKLAVNPAGEAITVWDQEVGSECATSPAALGCIHIMESNTRPAGGGWGTPIEISRPGVGAAPQVAINDAGDAAILWVHDIGRDRVLQASYRRGSAGSWPEPSDVSEPSLGVRSHQIALDSAGNAVAVWAERSQGVVYDAMVANRSAATGAWSTPVRLSSFEWRTRFGPELAVTPSGEASVVWIDLDAEVWSSTGDARTGRWTPRVSLSGHRHEEAHDPRIATNVAGDTAVAWTRGNTGDSAAFVEAVFRPHDGGWTQPVFIGLVPMSATGTLSLAVDERGVVTALYGGDGRRVEASVRSIDGTWAQQVVYARENATGTALAAGAAGNTVAVWTGGEPARTHAALRARPFEAWQQATELSADGASAPHVGLDAAGHAVAVWNRSASSAIVVESADLAGGGPILDRLTAPKRPVFVGARTRFSVRPVPWASHLRGLPRWHFGDGAATSGALVAHVYRRSGRFTVSVSQRDEAGDVTTSTAEVRVVAERLRNTKLPSIRGTPRIGSTLTCLHGAWTGSPPIRYAYGWRRDGKPVPGATTSGYRVRRLDAGSLIACEVTATNPGGSLRATSGVVGIER